MTVSVTIDTNGIEAMKRPGGAISDDMGRRALRVDSAAKAKAPVRTGRMRAAGYATPAADIPGAWDVIFPVNYSLWVNSGTRYMAARPFLTSSLVEAL